MILGKIVDYILVCELHRPKGCCSSHYGNKWDLGDIAANVFLF